MNVHRRVFRATIGRVFLTLLLCLTLPRLCRGQSSQPTTTDRERYPYIYGIKHPLERWNFGGIGIAGVHWLGKKQATLPKSMPFGRAVESGYVDGLRKFSQIKSPSRLIWFGDGAGYDGAVAKYGDDLGWWIRPQATDGSQCTTGFNRLLDENYGCQRHNKKANYAFADGHVVKLNANDIPCNQSECWWSFRPDYHRIPPAGSAP
jgi:prepilin-type processing-associated H-X9-DG protein